MKGKSLFSRPAISALIVAFVLLVLAASPALAAVFNPGVLPPNSHPFGKTYGEWSAAWWQWVFSIPEATNPLMFSDGSYCGANQSGKVWFLGGTFYADANSVGTANRNCTIPAGKAIFFPVLNSECSTVEGNGTTDAELRSCAVSGVNHTTSLSVTVDGVPLNGLDPASSPYRVQSPLYTFVLPEGALFGLPVGPSPSVSDGYWIMLAPLSKGQHTIQFAGTMDFPFTLDVTYHITVK